MHLFLFYSVQKRVIVQISIKSVTSAVGPALILCPQRQKHTYIRLMYSFLNRCLGLWDLKIVISVENSTYN